jgi:glutaredoxin 3
MQTVKIYTTGSCPFCTQAKALLKQRGVAELDEVRVDMLPGEREKMMQITGRRTVPQIFIGSTHVGGCDDLVALDGRGALLPLLTAA